MSPLERDLNALSVRYDYSIFILLSIHDFLPGISAFTTQRQKILYATEIIPLCGTGPDSEEGLFVKK